MKLYIDSREREKIPSIFKYWELERKRFPNIESIDVKLLQTGDIALSNGLVGIERKSSSDFISSICNGKLKQQLYELKQNYQYPFLFVEDYNGLMDCIESNPQIHPNVIIGATASTFAHSKVPICYVGAFYVPLMFNTMEKFLDGGEYTEIDYTPFRQTTSKKDFLRYVVRGLPNIGASGGEKLLEMYNYSIYRLVRGAVENNDNLLQIKGIGKKIAQDIKRVLE